MKAKLKLSVSLKLTLIVILVSVIAVSSIVILNIDVSEEQEHYLEAQYDKAASLIHDLNSSAGCNTTLENQTKLAASINEFKDWNEKILEVNINFPNEFDELTIFASTDEQSVNKSSNSYEVEGVDYSQLCYQDGDTYYIPTKSEGAHILVILSPIYLSGQIIGTYEIIISTEATYDYLDKVLDNRIRNIIWVSAIILIAMVFCFLFLLRKVIVIPIIKFRDSSRIIGKGNLDTTIDIKSRDELGDLANAFNQMTKDLKESRDKIQDYTEILENLLDQKDEFIGQLGHDLKNPLQPLVGLLPMIIEKEKDPKIKESLVLMNQNAEYMRNLIFDTLKLAKLRSSNIQFDFENLNLKQEADHVIASQQLNLKENKIDVENKIDEKIIVNADKLRLAEVFNNLISNAIKYTSKGGGKITIDAEQKKDFVTVTVKDTGIGMTKDQLKKAFDEFYKAQKGTEELQSTGLGLSICKRIIEKHGGKIWVESEGSDRGSTFYFTLKSVDEK